MDNTNQKKKLILYGIIATIAIFVIVLILLMVLMLQESKKTKIVFKGNTYKTRVIEMTAEKGQVYKQKNITFEKQELPIVLETPDSKQYFCIETLAVMTGYKYNKGAYGELDENTNKCYIDNGGEYVTFATDVNTISKNIKVKEQYQEELAGKESKASSTSMKQSEAEEEELFSIDKPVIKFADGKLYASYDAITQGFNMSVVINGSEITIYTIEDLVNSYSQFLAQKGYTLTKNFRNQRALYKGLAVAGKNGEYGVIELKNDGGYEEVISVKYDTVEYIQSIGEFIISSSSKYGMIAPGEEKPTISLKYDKIQLLDAEKKLYIVGIDNKFGVVNAKGETIIPTEYDQIGLSDISMYKGQGITSKYLLVDNCIPVKQNNEYGLYSIDGTPITKMLYVSIGCEDPATLIGNTSAMPTLILPLSSEINCLVYSRKDSVGQQRYGIVTTDGVTLKQAYYTAIYYMTVNGKTTYYFNKVDNNEVVTLEELINTNEKLKELVNGTENKPDEKNEEEIALNSAREILDEAITNVANGYYANELEGELIEYISYADNLLPSMEGYNIVELERQDENVKIVFEDETYRYEAYINGNAEIIEIKIL